MTPTRSAASWWCLAAAAIVAITPPSLAQTPAPAPEQPQQQAADWNPDSKGEFLPYRDAWPKRILRDGKPGVIIEVPAPIMGWTQTWAWLKRAEPSGADQMQASAWAAAGAPSDPVYAVEFESTGSYVVCFECNSRGLFSQNPRDNDRPQRAFFFLSAEELTGEGGTPLKTAEGTPRAILQRTSFVYYEPLAMPRPGSRDYAPIPRDKWRGLAVVMPGLFGTPDTVIDALIRKLRDRGWCVLRMLAQSSRFTETASFRIDLRKDLAPQAAPVAELLSDRAAECAYAVQAVVAKVLDGNPDLAALPRVMLGCSAGGLTLPCVFAREPEKYKAAVIVGGAADWWLINERSNYARGVDAIKAKWVPGEPTPQQEQEFDKAYLAAARLDAYHTAAALAGKPVFVIQGSQDRAVQSPLGDLLWERLGRPKREVLPFGHELLFAAFATRLETVVQWLDEQTK